MAEVAADRRSTVGVTLHALGNVFLGIALGLIAYYFVTDLFTEAQQRELVSELPGVVAAAQPQTVAAGEQYYFDGWAQQDRAFWTKLEDGKPFGRLVAPDMGLDSIVVKGTSRSALMKGPGWITWSDLPGPTGNCGI